MGDVTDGGDWTSADDYCGYRPTDICAFCPRCKQPTVLCNCEAVIQLWMVDEFKFDKVEEKHDHEKKSFLFTNHWEDVVYLMCQNIITIQKYKKSIELKDEIITNNENMHDYILSRFENIENCWLTLFLNGKVNKDQFDEFEKYHEETVNKLIEDKEWKNFESFDNYLVLLLNCSFFKENDIRIE